MHAVAAFNNSGTANNKSTFALPLDHGRARRAAEAAELCTSPDIQPISFDVRSASTSGKLLAIKT